MASSVARFTESQRTMRSTPGPQLSKDSLSKLTAVFQVTLDPKQLCFEAVLRACEDRDWEKIEACQDELDNLTNQQGQTILHHAACARDGELFAELFQRNIALERRDEDGNTALDIIAKNEDVLLLGRLWNQIDFEDIKNWEEVPSKAKELCRHSILLMDHFQTLSEKDQAKFYSKIGAAKKMQGQYIEAQKIFELALKIQQNSVDPDHFFATSFDLHSQCHYMKAQQTFEEALRRQQKALDTGYLDIARSLNNIGECRYSQGRHLEAQGNYELALLIQQKSLAPDYLEISRILDNIGNCLRYQRYFEKAQKKFEEVLEIRKRLTPDHPDIAICLSNIGDCLYNQSKNNQDKMQEAGEKFQQALRILKKSLKPTHPAIKHLQEKIGICDSPPVNHRYEFPGWLTPPMVRISRKSPFPWT